VTSCSAQPGRFHRAVSDVARIELGPRPTTWKVASREAVRPHRPLQDAGRATLWDAASGTKKLMEELKKSSRRIWTMR